jgi:hypothetical protein
MARPSTPIPPDKIEENFAWRDWFQKLSDKVFGSMSAQDSNTVSITGGTINGTSIGATTPSTGQFTTLSLNNALGTIYGGTGQTSYTNGQLLIGNTTGNTLTKATLTAGTNISITNGSGSISIAATGTGTGDVVGPASATDNAVARFDLTTGKLIQNSGVTIDDTNNISGILSQQFSNGSAVTLAAGKMWYDGSTGAWNLGMGNGNITQQVGEEIFVYGKASAAITDSPLQIIYHTGVVGASGVITFAPTVAGITDSNAIVGVATESLALNDFGRATVFGTVRSITTNGTAFGETWADDDAIWYNPVTGNPTKVEPVAPNIKIQIGYVIKAGSGGSGSFHVEIIRGSRLGGTDSNVQFGTLANTDLIQYSTSLGYWTNVTPTYATYSGTETLTNKRIDPRVTSAASASSLTPSVATADIYAYTALAAGLTINAPTGVPVDGNKLIFRLLDNGTSRTLTWDATYTVIGVTLPTATTISKTTYVGCIYNANNTRWDVIAVTTQA